MTPNGATEPRVSVVMPAYNAALHLEEAVASILSQTFADFELIVVDDGSTDETPAILARLAATDGRVRVHRQANVGMAGAANQGCRLARGEFLARLDSDDVAVPERLALQVAFLDGHPEVAVVGGAKLFFSGARIARTPTYFPRQDQEIKAALGSFCAFSHSTVMIRREAFWAVGGYRASFSMGEDYDLWLRMSERYALANLPQVLVHYRVHGGQASIASSRQQSLCALAGLASARCRRAGTADPFASNEDPIEPRLAALGVSEDQIMYVTIRSYLCWVHILLQLDELARAMQVFDRAASLVPGVSGSRRPAVLWSLTRTRLLVQLWQSSPRLFLLLKAARRACRGLWWRLHDVPDGGPGRLLSGVAVLAREDAA